MRCYYREKIYTCGNYVEIDVYPVFATGSRIRKKKAKPSSEVQSALNARNAQRRAIRLINANFTTQDIKCELTYAPQFLPESPEAAQRELQNFFRRVKRLRRRKGLSDLKYLATTEQGEKNGRLHHHVILSGGLLPNELAALWGKGYVLKIQPLQFDDEGVVGLARYFTKDKTLYRRYNASRNLDKPIEQERTGEISQKNVRYMAENPDDYCFVNGMYAQGMQEEYRVTSCDAVMNDINGLPYITIRMCRPGCWSPGFEPEYRQGG